jgi:hypothetical protein
MGGVFQGSDKEYLATCRSILRQLRIPISEIEGQAVLREQTQVARIDPETKNVHKEEPQEGNRFARLARAVEKLPIWSSSMVLSLTRERVVGYMQLHWPELPANLVQEAHHLAFQVEHGWKAPEQPGAAVETVQAGILHSPAIGLLMDIYPAIRVIYRPEDPRYGQKPVYYYDRHGAPCPIPRQAELPVEPLQQRNAGQPLG